jgi:hypothetical protein
MPYTKYWDNVAMHYFALQCPYFLRQGYVPKFASANLCYSCILSEWFVAFQKKSGLSKVLLCRLDDLVQACKSFLKLVHA